MRNLLTVPIFDDEDKTMVARHLFIISWTLMAIGWMPLVIAVFIPETFFRWLLVACYLESAGLILLVLNKYGHTRLVSILLIFFIWVAATGMALTGGGISSNAMSIYLIAVLIAGLVQGGKTGFITAVLCSLTGLFLINLEYSGMLPANKVPHTPFTMWIANTIYMFTIISFQYLISRTIREALTKSRQELKERKRAEEELRNSREQYRSFVENMNDVIFSCDLQGTFTYMSPAIEIISRYTVGEVVGLSFSKFIHPDDLRGLAVAFKKTGSGIKRAYEFRVLDKTGEVHWVITKTKLVAESDKPPYIAGIMTDITQRKQTEDALKESEELFRNYLEYGPDGVYMSTLEGNFLYGNRKCEEIIGYRREELIGKNFLELNLLPEKSLNKAVQLLQANMENKPTGPDEFELTHKEGRLIPVEINTNVIQRMGKKIVLAFVRDITDRKQAEEELRESEKRYRELSIIDSLTQLFNSRHFYVQLKIELERSNRYEHPLTILMLDLDDFKAFNDVYGHIEGDQVLRRLGYVIKRCLRETDSAYRYGGEEFTIILPLTTIKDAAITAERIRTELKKETFSTLSGQEVHLTVSIGLAQYKPQEDIKAFVQRADQLMYQAKKNGKDRICLEP